MTVTNDELLVLNALIYTDEFKDVPNEHFQTTKTVYEFVRSINVNNIHNDNMPALMNKEAVQNLVTAVLANPQVYNQMHILNIDNTQKANQNGDARVVNVAISYHDELIVLYKGTAGSMEWYDNGEGAQIGVLETEQQKRAEAYFEKIYRQFPHENVVVSGHSKGGNKAMHVGVKKGDRITRVVSFDGQGFNQSYIHQYGELIEKHRHKITAISNQFDYVNIVMTSVAGTQLFVATTTMDGAQNATDGLLQTIGSVHSPYSMLHFDNKTAKMNTLVAQAPLMTTLKSALTYMEYFATNEDYNNAVTSLMQLMTGDRRTQQLETINSSTIKNIRALIAGWLVSTHLDSAQKDIVQQSFAFGLNAPYTMQLRDYSKALQEHILGLVRVVDLKEPSDNPLYKMDTYVVESSVLALLETYQQQNRMFHDRVVQQQEETIQKINAIFERVYAVDRHYSQMIDKNSQWVNQLCRQIEQMNMYFSFHETI